jgi:hypothetical protein
MDWNLKQLVLIFFQKGATAADVADAENQPIHEISASPSKVCTETTAKKHETENIMNEFFFSIYILRFLNDFSSMNVFASRKKYFE